MCYWRSAELRNRTFCDKKEPSCEVLSETYINILLFTFSCYVQTTYFRSTEQTKSRFASKYNLFIEWTHEAFGDAMPPQHFAKYLTTIICLGGGREGVYPHHGPFLKLGCF